jgi:hypothetical protein
MPTDYRKLDELVGYRLVTTDGEEAALRDVVIDVAAWEARYLVAGADAWAPHPEVLVAVRSLTGVDDARREIALELPYDQVRNAPSLSPGTPVTRGFEENYYRFYDWEPQWAAEINTEPFGDAPGPTGPPVEEPLAAHSDPDQPGLLRFEDLLGWTAEPQGGGLARPRELLVDDSDWSIPFIELMLDNLSVRERYLVARSLVSGFDLASQRLYLGVTADAMRQAPLKPYPAAEACDLRVLTEDDAGMAATKND